MSIEKSGIKRTWELRQLSMMADRANIGLGLILEGDKNVSLLQDGIRFCNSLIEGLESEDYDSGEDSWTNVSKSAVLRDKERLDELKEIGIDAYKLHDSVVNIKTTLERLSSGSERVTPEEISDLQDKIHRLSMMFCKADVINLRRLKKKRSLKAYG